MMDKKEAGRNWIQFVFLSIICILTGVNVGVTVKENRLEGMQPEAGAADQPGYTGSIQADIRRTVFPYDPYLENHDGLWNISDAGSHGLKEEGVAAYLELCRKTGADTVLIAYKDNIVGEWYSSRYEERRFAAHWDDRG